jgi:sulfur-oxidizing protein SoxA
MNFKTITRALVVLGAGTALAACQMDASQASNPNGSDLWSGYRTASAETQAMQDDDFANPGMPVVDSAFALYNKKDGEADVSCAECHGAVDDPKGGAKGIPMKGVAARYPAYDAESKKPINVELRINKCRTKYQKAKAYKYESDAMQGMTGLIAMQSRGIPKMSTADISSDELNAAWKAGEAFYYQRRGQLDMSCKHCHEDHQGELIRAETLSQGQSNGFPAYRLKWNKMGSLHRRFRGCNKNIRAEPYGFGSEEYLNLETYLAWRGRGLPMESPSVRK